jgi:hypothetical protein
MGQASVINLSWYEHALTVYIGEWLASPKNIVDFYGVFANFWDFEVGNRMSSQSNLEESPGRASQTVEKWIYIL